MKSIKNTVPGGGSYASNVLATQQNINKALTEIDTLEANTNSKLKGDADKLNITRKDAANMEALKMNLATQQAKELLQQEALTQGKGLSEQAIANKLAQNYAVMSAPDISRFKKVGYNPYYQQVLESIKNRKTTPKI
jgi:ribosomal protein S9